MKKFMKKIINADTIAFFSIIFVVLTSLMLNLSPEWVGCLIFGNAFAIFIYTLMKQNQTVKELKARVETVETDER